MESRPDLTIQDFNVSPAEVTPGGSIDVSCVLLNLGGTASDETEIRLYLSLDEVIDAADHDLAYGSMDPLDPGGRVGVTGQDITLPTDLASGYWFALIEADSRHALDESNEGNNVASARLKVLGNGPDLTITNVSLFPAVILPGTNVRITFNVYNAGNVGASPVKAIFYLSGDEFLDPSDQNVADASTRILGAKTNSLMNCGFVPGHSIAGGQFYLIGMMDPDGVVKEIDEENNRYVKPVTIAGTSGTGGITMSEGIRVYPIPAHDRLIIELTDNSGREGSLVIRDLPGRTLFERDFKPGGLRKCEIDVTSWPRGTYLAYFSGGMTYGAARIVLQ
jgi:subtilase family serine protease